MQENYGEYSKACRNFPYCILYASIKVQRQAEVVFAVRSQDNGYSLKVGSDWKKDMGMLLFLDLGAGYAGVFSFRRLVKVCPYDMYTFLYLKIYFFLKHC